MSDLIAEAFRKVLETDAAVVRARAEDEARPLLQVIADRHVLKAADGHLATAVWIVERIAGRPGIAAGQVTQRSLDDVAASQRHTEHYIRLLTAEKIRQGHEGRRGDDVDDVDDDVIERLRAARADAQDGRSDVAARPHIDPPLEVSVQMTAEELAERQRH